MLITSSLVFQHENYVPTGGNHGLLGNPPESPKYPLESPVNPPESPVIIFITFMGKNVCLTICQYMHFDMLCMSYIKQFSSTNLKFCHNYTNHTVWWWFI